MVFTEHPKLTPISMAYFLLYLYLITVGSQTDAKGGTMKLSLLLSATYLGMALFSWGHTDTSSSELNTVANTCPICAPEFNSKVFKG